MIDRLALLAPGDARPTTGPALVILDDREYGAELFAPIAREVVAGPGIECRPTDVGPVFVRKPTPPATNGAPNHVHVLFFVETDTDVKTQAPIARHFSSALFIVQPGQDDSALRALDAEGLDFQWNDPGRPVPAAHVALMSSDWSIPRREFVRRCRAKGVATLCLQEAINVDFDGPPHRMRWADCICVSGPHALRYLSREVNFLTGNPRFDGYRPAPPPSKPLVLINCNFILGLGGERGPGWMSQVLGVVRDLGLEHRVSKHPRDDTDLSDVDHVLPSGAYRVVEQLAACSVLVSRDSSLPYEAMLTGRPVIYFDPYHEKERTLREDDSGLIRKCDSVDGLRAALRDILANPGPVVTRAPGFDPYSFLFTEAGAGSTERVVRALRTLGQHPDVYRTSDAMSEHGFALHCREWFELRARPRLKRITPLRTAWRAARRVAGR